VLKQFRARAVGFSALLALISGAAGAVLGVGSSGRSAAEKHDFGTALKREAVAAGASYAPG
jgi:hypothetical protein